MSFPRRLRPSPAMVVACIALTVALGGTSVAAIEALPHNSVGTKQLKKNAVTSPKVKNNSITGSDVREASLGTVPAATHATTADSAAPSGVAGGALTGTYPNPGLAAPEAWHEIGAAGEPSFQHGWINADATKEVTAAYYKDPFGVVHLKGLVGGGTNDVIFVLPPDFRPGKVVFSLLWRSSGAGLLVICVVGSVCTGGQDGGVVIASGAGSAALDTITFRAGE